MQQRPSESGAGGIHEEEGGGREQANESECVDV